jgi:hypothetical protein
MEAEGRILTRDWRKYNGRDEREHYPILTIFDNTNLTL